MIEYALIHNLLYNEFSSVSIFKAESEYSEQGVMELNYPNGRKQAEQPRSNHERTKQLFSNRGMTLENDINATNEFYREMNLAVIHKKPTPVQIVKVNYPKRSAAVITEAYFKQPSTTDYNGVYKGRYIDFEAKETQNKTAFPLANIHPHQVEHIRTVVGQNGISFLLIRFALFEETFYFPGELLLEIWDDMQHGGRKSIPYQQLKDRGYLVPFHYQKRVDYLSIIEQLHF